MMNIYKLLGTLLLLDEAGDGDGGGGGTSEASSSEGTNAGSSTDDDNAPVTRAELRRFMAELKKEPAPKPTGQNTSSQPDSRMPKWAQEQSAKIDQILARDRQNEVRGRKQTLTNRVLDQIPNENRGLAELALEGLINKTGINLEGDNIDVDKLAKDLGDKLRSQFGSQLLAVPGSKLKAVPKGVDGSLDWSKINSFSDVPHGMMREMPDEVVHRIIHGGGQSGRNDGLPQNLFSRGSPAK